ncbi:TPA: GNAT family N-acetyltransferase [Raoultella ornithinolytica]
MHCIIAEENDTFVGMVNFVYHRSTWTKDDYCYLQDLFVSSSMRGKGVGKSLIEEVYKIAQNDGCSRVYWLTQENNYSARRLYDAVAGKN